MGTANLNARGNPAMKKHLTERVVEIYQVALGLMGHWLVCRLYQAEQMDFLQSLYG